MLAVPVSARIFHVTGRGFRAVPPGGAVPEGGGVRFALMAETAMVCQTLSEADFEWSSRA